MIHKVTFTCKAGHSQTIEYIGLTREFAETQAKLIDGSSPLYKFPPGPDSIIGKCGICKAQLTSTVLDEPSDDTISHPSPPASVPGT